MTIEISPDHGLVKCGERTIRDGCPGCGSLDLYRGHYANGDGTFGGTDHRSWCATHGTSEFILIDRAGREHKHDVPVNYMGNGNGSAPSAPTPADKSAAATQLADLIGSLAKGTVDESQVQAMIDAKLGGFAADMVETVGQLVSSKLASMTMPHVVRIDRADAPSVTITGAHKMLPKLVSALNRRRNILMVGMAGTGKTTLARQCAEALSIPFYDMSLSPDLGRHALTGYMTADGTFIPPQLYFAFRDGGLFHWDEVDNGNPGLLVTVNQVLSNGHMRFADGTEIAKHEDFRAMCSGNTYGNGPDSIYVGRQALDGAFKNRFIVVTILVDEAVEEAMCRATGAPDHIVMRVLRYVRALRESATRQRLPILFTPRNSENMCELFMAEWTADEIIESAARMGLPDDTWRTVSAGCPGFTF